MWLTFIRWTCISLHSCLIFCIQLLIQLRNMILSCSMFRWTCSKLVYISAFRVSMLILLNTFATWCKIWFYNVSSLHSLFDSFFFFSRWCQTDALNAISDFTTAEYICLAFVKIASHVKTSSQLSASIHVTWFTSIWRRCTSHCNFMFSCTLRTHTSDFNLNNWAFYLYASHYVKSFWLSDEMHKFILFWCKCCVMNASLFHADIVCFAQCFENFFNESIIC